MTRTMELFLDYNKMCLVPQLCPTLCSPMDCSLPVCPDHGILQERILKGVAIPFSRGSSWPSVQTCISYISGRFFTIWAIEEDPYNWIVTKLESFACYQCFGFSFFQRQLFFSISLLHTVFNSHPQFIITQEKFANYLLHTSHCANNYKD